MICLSFSHFLKALVCCPELKSSEGKLYFIVKTLFNLKDKKCPEFLKYIISLSTTDRQCRINTYSPEFLISGIIGLLLSIFLHTSDSYFHYIQGLHSQYLKPIIMQVFHFCSK